jgi:hypothetical protein
MIPALVCLQVPCHFDLAERILRVSGCSARHSMRASSENTDLRNSTVFFKLLLWRIAIFQVRTFSPDSEVGRKLRGTDLHAYHQVDLGRRRERERGGLGGK